MHTESVQVLVPPVIQAPRGSIWAASAAAWLIERFSVGRVRADRVETPLAGIAQARSAAV